jgi:hypothetical protein
MQQIRCQFCHKYIDKELLLAHQEQHLKLRSDGQQTDYATLPKEEREQSDLTDVPSVYLHNHCRIATEMPEDIIRSYLVNPYLYFSDQTFCTGCNKHVPFRECKWIETGENLQVYMNRLREEKPEHRPGFLTRVLLGLVKQFN